MSEKRIFLFGFWGLEVMYYHMINIAREKGFDVEWTIVTTTDHHQKLLSDLIGQENVLVLDRSVNDVSTVPYEKIDYFGNLHKDIESEKRTFKHRSAERQKNIALKLYRQILDFANQHQPTHFLASRIEGIEGKVFISAAKNINAELIVPTHLRNIDGWFFSPDDYESLPNYYGVFSKQDREQAIEYLDRNRSNPLLAKGRDKSLLFQDEPTLNDFKSNHFIRIVSGIKRLLTGVNPIEFGTIRYIFLMNFPWVRETIWWIRKTIASKNYDVDDIHSLPKNFIYFPIQYSPESSINVPAPYFIDQIRAIDAIRFAMPTNYALVVKEHPNCLEVRPLSFLRSIRKKSGVITVCAKMDGISLIKRAQLTISITGTSTLEAFMIGRASINLGSCFLSNIYNGVTSIDGLKLEIERLLGYKIENSVVTETIAKIFAVRYEFVFCQPGVPGEPLLRKGNISKFLLSLLDHIEKVKEVNLSVSQEK
jgi:hypothetical protein